MRPQPQPLFRPLLLIAFAALLAQPAAACINSMIRLDGKQAASRLARAEVLLEQGEHARVRSMLAGRKYEFVEEAHEQRAEVLRAAALMRGNLTLDDAVKRLMAALREAPDDPQVTAWLAEAMTRRIHPARTKAQVATVFRPDTPTVDETLSPAARERVQKAALTLLGRLEKADLMPDAFAYATLTALHDLAGDEAAYDKALERCRVMTRTPGICHLFP